MRAIVDLDANATTKADPRVAEKMTQVDQEVWGNPSSDNALGKAARQEVESARSQVARLIGADPDEIVFTSSVTESINVAIQGLVAAHKSGRPHILTSKIEHTAILSVLAHLHRSHGVAITALSPDRWGQVTQEQVRKALRPETLLVCLSHGNNEVGTLNDIAGIGSTLRQHPAHFFVDASQTLAYLPLKVHSANIDLLCISAHKMYGPKGVGALYARRGIRLSPVYFGGGQEKGLSPGTPNVAGIAGMGKAAELARLESGDRLTRVSQLRRRFLERLQKSIADARLNGHPEFRLPGNLSLTIPHIPSEVLQRRLPHLAFSRGSACTAASTRRNHVLLAIGLSLEEIDWTLRIGLSNWNLAQEVDSAVDNLAGEILALRGESLGLLRTGEARSAIQ